MIKVLFPTDFSYTANNALLYALNLCKNLEGEMVIFHSYTPSLKDENNAEKINQINQKFIDLKSFIKSNELSLEKISCIYEAGEIIQNIQELLSKDHYDIVMMGTTGNSGFENKVLGSKTAAVFKNIEKPVLCIPHLANYEGIDSIGFATLYTTKEAEILRKMIDFSKQTNADIYCINVNENDIQADNSLWKNQFVNDNVTFVEKRGDNVIKSIFEFIEENSIDIISCTITNKSFFDRVFENSISEKLAYHKKIPLLTLHK